jgi:hypothetical protein
VIVILASYPRTTLTIAVDLRGCNDVSNGSGAPGGFRRYIASMRLLKHLAKLTGYRGYF